MLRNIYDYHTVSMTLWYHIRQDFTKRAREPERIGLYVLYVLYAQHYFFCYRMCCMCEYCMRCMLGLSAVCAYFVPFVRVVCYWCVEVGFCVILCCMCAVYGVINSMCAVSDGKVGRDEALIKRVRCGSKHRLVWRVNWTQEILFYDRHIHLGSDQGSHCCTTFLD